MKKKFKKTVIVGTGLLGGSIGIILRKKKLSSCVVGVARHSLSLEKAIEKKAIDYGTMDVKEAVQGADLVILAAPVRAIEKIIMRMRDELEKGCIIFDVGSTKQEIVSFAEKYLPKSVNFVGAHPMAGSEKTGVAYSDATLFKNSTCFICKTKKTNKKALSSVQELWKILGAKTVMISPLEHDRVVAYISHLPHLIAAAIVNSIPDKCLKFAATGFKDTTRIASGGPDIWRDISFSNRKAILSAITFFEKKLGDLKKSLTSNKEKQFTQKLLSAKKKRDKIY
ncbi:MAG: prephenate dehydrogenase [PVC group bacterium]|nr:prephenate dehydrogenase [PVC group bacterium]